MFGLYSHLTLFLPIFSRNLPYLMRTKVFASRFFSVLLQSYSSQAKKQSATKAQNTLAVGGNLEPAWSLRLTLARRRLNAGMPDWIWQGWWGNRVQSSHSLVSKRGKSSLWVGSEACTQEIRSRARQKRGKKVSLFSALFATTCVLKSVHKMLLKWDEREGSAVLADVTSRLFIP